LSLEGRRPDAGDDGNVAEDTDEEERRTRALELEEDLY
jgi:hypothetical protein